MSFCDHLCKANKAVVQADGHNTDKNTKAALKSYQKARRHLECIFKLPESALPECAVLDLVKRLHQYVNARLICLKDVGASTIGRNGKRVVVPAPASVAAAPSETPAPVTPEMSEDNEVRSIVESCVILADAIGVSMDDVVGMHAAKRMIHEITQLPFEYPRLTRDRISRNSNILFFGPPGNGKTYVAKAVASDNKATFISMSSADIVSKWQGVSERVVKILFQTAREKSRATGRQCIVFLDEIDSIARERCDDESESERRIKTQLLQELDGIRATPCDSAVVVIACTNVPWELDAAFLRRFSNRVHLPLPDKQTRSLLIRKHMSSERHSMTDLDFVALASETDGYSASDISNSIAREALLGPVRDVTTATYFRRVPTQMCGGTVKWCTATAKGAVQSSYRRYKDAELCREPVTMMHWIRAIQSTSRTTTDEQVSKYETWSAQGKG